MTLKPDYGLDAPVVVQRLTLASFLFICTGTLLSLLPVTRANPAVRPWALRALTAGFGCGLTAGVMTWGSRVGKLGVRDRILGVFLWKGNERVLDVGCGHGLMLIGAAKRVPQGAVIGVDLWINEDQAENSADATRENARRESVAERIELRDGDARKLPFEKAHFDVVLSSWALHNINEPAGRLEAIREICRVLKPGGRVAIADIRHAADYANEFKKAGLINVRLSGPNFIFVTPTRTVFAEKPAAASR